MIGTQLTLDAYRNSARKGIVQRQTPEQARASLARRWHAQSGDHGDGCWEWTGTTDGHGYGTIGAKQDDGRWVSAKAHRVGYELLVGPIPDGLHLDHLCRNRRCVNPAHLEPVTNRENGLRGESPLAHHARKTHCHRGHEFTPENTRQRVTAYGTPGRECRQCEAIQTAERRTRSTAGAHVCSCGRSFATARGLHVHMSKACEVAA